MEGRRKGGLRCASMSLSHLKGMTPRALASNPTCRTGTTLWAHNEANNPRRKADERATCAGRLTVSNLQGWLAVDGMTDVTARHRNYLISPSASEYAVVVVGCVTSFAFPSVVFLRGPADEPAVRVLRAWICRGLLFCGLHRFHCYGRWGLEARLWNHVAG